MTRFYQHPRKGAFEWKSRCFILKDDLLWPYPDGGVLGGTLQDVMTDIRANQEQQKTQSPPGGLSQDCYEAFGGGVG